MASNAGDRFLRQLSASNGDEGVCGGLQLDQQQYGGAGAGRRGSRRWSKKRAAAAARGYGAGAGGSGYGVNQQAEAASAARKRVMVVVDETSGAKHAMMWALTHVANKGDFLTLLHVLPPQSGSGGSGGSRGVAEDASALANSLGALCKACKPEVRLLLYSCSHAQLVSTCCILVSTVNR